MVVCVMRARGPNMGGGGVGLVFVWTKRSRPGVSASGMRICQPMYTIPRAAFMLHKSSLSHSLTLSKSFAIRKTVASSCPTNPTNKLPVYPKHQQKQIDANCNSYAVYACFVWDRVLYNLKYNRSIYIWAQERVPAPVRCSPAHLLLQTRKIFRAFQLMLYSFLDLGKWKCWIIWIVLNVFMLPFINY